MPADLTAAEQAMVRHAVADHAGRWHGQVGALHLRRSHTARYLAEATLGGLCDRHGLPAVARAVAAAIDANPAVLHVRHSDADIAARRAAREQAADALARAADAAYRAGDHPAALSLLDQAEQELPEEADVWADARRQVAATATLAA